MAEPDAALSNAPQGSSRTGSNKPIRAAQALFLLMATVWFAIGVGSVVRIAGASVASRATAIVIAVLMGGNVAAYAVVAWGLGWRRRPFYFLGLLLLAVNILLTFTDQFGALDLITLLVDVALVVLLIVTRSHYLRHQPIARDATDNSPSA